MEGTNDNGDSPMVSVIGKLDPQTGIYRHGFGLKSAVAGEITGDYFCPIVEAMKANNYRLDADGVSFFLAREFGFCYGVDKAVDYAYQTRRMFPDKRIFLTTEIIHNPRVNRRLIEMGVGFLTGQYAHGMTYDAVQPGDVVILPAFGASVQEVERLRQRGCTLVDTTCGSVILVWKRVEKYAREGFTAVIHGKYAHEETIGTSSRVTQFPGGKYLVVRDKAEAQLVCDFITGRAEERQLADKFANAMSPGFDFARDLSRVGVANQTTMLSSESLEIAGMLRDALAERYGAAGIDAHFRNFDTICSATQERQDAMVELREVAPDLVVVVGGFNSSNTTHLVEIAGQFAPTYHVEDAACLVSRDIIRHKPYGLKDTMETTGWLPERPVKVGLTAGASTPNRAIGEVVERICALLGAELALPDTASVPGEK